MDRKLVYSKHRESERCGVAFFSATLARKIGAEHVHGYQGFGRCDEFYVNMDIFELEESEVESILRFINSGQVAKTILIMHDYRFSYLEDQLIRVADVVVNLSSEPGLSELIGVKHIALPGSTLTESPKLGMKKSQDNPVSLAFGFFSPRKKSFNKYVDFYQYMLSTYPTWLHIVVASAHVGDSTADSEFLRELLDDESIIFMDFIPNTMLAELVSIADIGVCFYPTGIMSNNAAPMSFFSQRKTVVTNYGVLTPEEFKTFTIDETSIESIDFSDVAKVTALGKSAGSYFDNNLTWDHLVAGINGKLSEFR